MTTRPAARRATVGLALFGLLLGACTPDGETDDPPEETAPEPTDPVEDEPPPSPTLARLPTPGLDAEVGELELHDVHGDGAGWLAVGAATEPGQRPHSVALASDDGEAWEALELPAPEADEHRARAVARVDDTALVVGVAGGEDERHLVVWVETDDGWALSELDDELGTWPLATVHNAIGVDGHAVAVGAVTDEDGEVTQAAWTLRPDGTAEPAALDPAAGWIRDVAVRDDQLLAVGASAVDEGTTPRVLRSDDAGASWEVAAEEPEGLAGGEVHVLEPDDDGWLAGGRVAGDGGQQAAVWRSSDGVDWEPVGEAPGFEASQVRGVHRLDGQLLAVGTWLYVVTDDDVWQEPAWPGPGAHGWFGVSATHDDRLVAVGGAEDGVTDLFTATGPDDVERIPVADDVLDRTEGVVQRWVGELASDGERLVTAGGQVVLEDLAATERTFLGVGAEVEPAGRPTGARGRLVTAAHVDGVGFVAAGSTASSEHAHAGAHVLLSPDGEDWSLAEDAAAEPEDRVHAVLALDGRVLLAGMSWRDDAPVALLWELTDERLEPRDTPDLDGFGVVDGCAGGEVVALILFPGDASRVLAVSRDGGEGFTLLDDGPLAGGGELTCAVDPAGELVVAARDATGSRVYRVDDGDRAEPVEVELPPGTMVTAVRHLPDVGWALVGTEDDGVEQRGLLHVAPDLRAGVTLRLETGGASSEAADAAVADGRLHVAGREGQTAGLWVIDLDELSDHLAADDRD